MQRVLDKLRAGQKTTIVALGDSNTELTWHTHGRLNWVGLLQEALFETYGRNTCWMINSGKCGDTACDAIQRVQDDALRFLPDLVIVSFGMNDSSAGTTPDNLAEFGSALRHLVMIIRAERDCQVMFRTPNPVVIPPCNAKILAEEEQIGMEARDNCIGLYAKETVDLAEELACIVVDHYATWKRVEQQRGRCEEPNHLWLYMSDPIHPGPLGHLAFFREIASLFGVRSHFPWEPDDSLQI